MKRKDKIDTLGAASLIVFSALIGLNQVLIKIVNDGLQPVFQAGMRSVFAFVIVFSYAVIRGNKINITDGSLKPGIITGIFFGLEFVLLFLALDYTTVGRASIMFYSMPVWLTIVAHFLIPNEKITFIRILGLLCAVVGLAWALSDNISGGYALLGDLMCIIGSILWAGIVLFARLSNLRKSTPEMQLIYQLAVSPFILIPVAFFFGPFIRDLQLLHIFLFGFQVIGIVSIGFVLWFWVLSIYPASDMASFSFLAPVFGVIFGWLVLGENIGITIVGSLFLVSVGIILINWKKKSG
ncbi:MAG: DMT family transporter [Paracoccaceae bacterium]|nr:DMT family transporter [Paracoccaceae bacterium]|tara:strand:+ start:4386 stop:5273 length:888 start_codon:yes stop_codon:yes gene_type:complete